jgi:predicted dehydrogenase
MLTIALVGCAHIHTPGFVDRLNKRVDAGQLHVKYVWDPNPARAEKRAADLNSRTDSGGIVTDLTSVPRAKVVTGVGKIFADAQVQAVVICSETKLHKSLVLKAAAAKKHVFVEKPLGMGANDAQTMAEAVIQAGVLYQTGYAMRSDPKFNFIRTQIAQGNFGKITRVRGSNCHSGALGGWFDAKPQDPANDWRWMADPKLAGCGGFGDMGTHLLDILMWLLGDVEAVAAKLDNGIARYPDCDELGEALLKFKSGAIGTLAAGWDDVANPVPFFLSGTEGHATIFNGQLYFVSKKVTGADGKAPWTDLPAATPHPLDLFVDAASGAAGLPLVTVTEAAARSITMQAIYKAAAGRKWVAVA